jgi:enamine deaminase RidA (YjgF/YER057c/UK114 family)
MDERAQSLSALGYALDKLPKPAASYLPVVLDGTTAYLSGAIPFDGDQNLVSQGSVPSQVSVAEAQKAARLCAANLLRVLAAEIGSLERIDRVIRVAGYVNSDPGFSEQHIVINAASELLTQVLGSAGKHARSAIGTCGLPLSASVELDMIVRVRS